MHGSTFHVATPSPCCIEKHSGPITPVSFPPTKCGLSVCLFERGWAGLMQTKWRLRGKEQSGPGQRKARVLQDPVWCSCYSVRLGHGRARIKSLLCRGTSNSLSPTYHKTVVSMKWRRAEPIQVALDPLAGCKCKKQY